MQKPSIIHKLGTKPFIQKPQKKKCKLRYSDVLKEAEEKGFSVISLSGSSILLECKNCSVLCPQTIETNIPMLFDTEFSCRMCAYISEKYKSCKKFIDTIEESGYSFFGVFG